jgi:hypothetical protein
MYDTGFKVLSMKINHLALIFMKNVMTPIPCNEGMRANFHGQASDAYAYA